MRYPISLQAWCTFTALHWAYDPAVLRPLVPSGLELQTFDGAGWVSLTPFVMKDVRAPLLPPIPRWSTFPETNLRTYVIDAHGHDGIWFFALEAARRPFVVAARTAYGLAYNWADMSVEDLSGVVRYRSRRRWGGPPAHSDITVEVGDPIPAERVSDLDVFLNHRWRGYAPSLFGLAFTPVEHEPWPLRQASVRRLDETLLAAAHLPSPEADAVAHYSPGVDVRLGPPSLVY